MAFHLVDLFREFGLDFVTFCLALGLIQLPAEFFDPIHAFLQFVNMTLHISTILETRYVLRRLLDCGTCSVNRVDTIDS